MRSSRLNAAYAVNIMTSLTAPSTERRSRLTWGAIRNSHAQSLCVLLATVGLLTGCQRPTDQPKSSGELSPVERAAAGKAVWEEKCRTVAGEKIYRKVEGVEGVLLLKVRPKAWEPEWADTMWPGAAFALEAQGEEYITTFLGYEYAAGEPDGRPGVVTRNARGYIATDRRPGGLPGYRFVDVVDERGGDRYRYSGSVKIVGRKDTSAAGVKSALSRDPNYDLNVYRWTLDKIVASGSSPRYGVTFEDHVIPEDRAVGVASSTIKVIDLQTQEVLGEMTRYAWSTGASRANPSPWLTAYKCPGHAVGASEATRKFVDQVLIPQVEK